jgi:AraC-like DNA-binding protein
MPSRSSDLMVTRWSEMKRWGHGDPLSSVLLDLRLSGTFFCNSAFGAPWAVEIAPRDFASFHFVATGDCWLQTLPGGRSFKPLHLREGDLVILPRSPRQIFSSSRSKSGTPLDQLPTHQFSETAAALRQGGDKARWLVVCGGVRFEGFAAATLAKVLPDTVVLRSKDASPIVASALQAMRQESLAARPGSVTLMTRLADVVMIHAIRAWIEQPGRESGWVAALQDAQIGRAIAAVHERPEEPWTVEGLAEIAHLSRSRFSQRFAALVGSSPMQYVTKVRMFRAREQLRGERLSVGEVAGRFGYDSEPAFARAFKRHTGLSPGAARRDPAST